MNYHGKLNVFTAKNPDILAKSLYKDFLNKIQVPFLEKK